MKQFFIEHWGWRNHGTNASGVFGSSAEDSLMASEPEGNGPSGLMPTLTMLVPEGVWYRATVTDTADPSESGTRVGMRPLPKVVSPRIRARLLSRSAPARTSEADAVPLSTKSVRGNADTIAVPSASNTSRTPSLSDIYTIAQSSMKSFTISIASWNKPLQNYVCSQSLWSKTNKVN